MTTTATAPCMTNAEFAHLLTVLYLHESWRPACGFPGYKISSHGRLQGKRGWILKPHLAGHKGEERLKIGLRRNGKKHKKTPHRMVLEAFVGPCPPGMEACHWDDNYFHNHAWNLRWDTRLANEADKRRNGKTPRGSLHYHAKMTEAEVIEIRRLHKEGRSLSSLASMFGLSKAGVRFIAIGRTWGHVMEHSYTPALHPVGVGAPTELGVLAAGWDAEGGR